MFALVKLLIARDQQFYSAKIKSAELIYSSRLKLVFVPAHVKCDV